MEAVHTSPIAFSTPRLELRRLVHADLDHLAELYAEVYAVPSVRRFLRAEALAAGAGAPSLDGTRAQLAAIERHWETYGFGHSAVIERATGDFIGRVGLQVHEPWDDIELDVVIAPDRQRRGYATEAGRVWVDWARRAGLAERLVAVIHRRHEAVLRTARALGFLPDPGSPPAWVGDRTVHRLVGVSEAAGY